MRCKGKEHTVAITDAMEAAGMPDGKYQLGGQDVFVKEGAARLEDGTLAGSTLTMIRAFQNLIRFGASPEDAALMTTRTPPGQSRMRKWAKSSWALLRSLPGLIRTISSSAPSVDGVQQQIALRLFKGAEGRFHLSGTTCHKWFSN